MTIATKHTMLGLRFALLTAFDYYEKTIRDGSGGSLHVEGNRTSTWVFKRFLVADERNRVALDGVVPNVDLNNQNYPVDIRGSLALSMSPQVARGKVVGVRPPTPIEPDDLGIDRESLLSIKPIPSTIFPLTSLQLGFDVTIQQRNTTGVVWASWPQGQAVSRRTNIDSLDIEERSAFYWTPTWTREELVDISRPR